MKVDEILNIINKCSTFDIDGSVKYVDTMDYNKLANMLEEASNVTSCIEFPTEDDINEQIPTGSTWKDDDYRVRQINKRKGAKWMLNLIKERIIINNK